MNRFDDKLSWRFFEKLIAPAISVALAYVVFRVNLENRVTTVEVKTETVISRLDRMEGKIDRLLDRELNRRAR